MLKITIVSGFVLPSKDVKMTIVSGFVLPSKDV